VCSVIIEQDFEVIYVHAVDFVLSWVLSSVRKWLATGASLMAGAGWFALWFWLLQHWFGSRVEMAGAARWRWLAAIPSVLGFAVALRCVWDFARTGRGSPAPFAPPNRLVVIGFYRYVRNPIYVGAASGWIGLWIVFGHASRASIVMATAAILGVHLFVTLYEEPTLRRNVRRWLPRVPGWSKAQ
jgi:protein-S-isoprenylcysteine O-methyltransferase Ste14